MPPPAPPPAVATEAKPPTSTEAMPATRPDVLPPIDVGAWLRVGGKFQGEDPSKVNDWHMDNAYVELHAGGKITKNIGVTLNLNANIARATPSSGGEHRRSTIEDAIISFDFVDEFHLWAGHLLVPVDRANASGPFFMIPWNYPGFFAAGNGYVGAPAEGPSGRNNGAVSGATSRAASSAISAACSTTATLRAPPPLRQPAVFGEVAAGAARSGAGLLGQRQLLRRQGHPVVRRGRTGPGTQALPPGQQDLRRHQRRRASSKRSSGAAASSPQKRPTTTSTSPPAG